MPPFALEPILVGVEGARGVSIHPEGIPLCFAVVPDEFFALLLYEGLCSVVLILTS